MFIYVITNVINNKKYIGKTNDPKRRQQEHFSNSNLNHEPNKVLYRAMEKYGKENFIFNIIEECDNKDWEEREQYWIEKENTILPFGYNMIQGGSEPPHYQGEKSPRAKLNDKEVEDIQNLLMKYTYKEISTKDIAKQFNISVDQVKRINSGQRGYNDKLKYPLRQYNIKDNVQDVQNLLSTWNYTCQEIADMYNVSLGCIKAINNGQNFHNPQIIYPIKPSHLNKGLNRKKYKEIITYINNGINVVEIARLTQVDKKIINKIKDGKLSKYFKNL